MSVENQVRFGTSRVRTTPISRAADMTDRVVVVTGGARGIGRAAALALADIGADVAILDLLDAASTRDEIESLGRECLTLSLDVGDRAAVHQAMADVAAWKGRIDSVVCAAGIVGGHFTIDQGLGVLDEEIVDRVLRVNLKGTLWCLQAAMPHLEVRGGTIVCIGSRAAKAGGLYCNAHYTASKGGVHSIVKYTARYGTQHGIRANAIAPGYINSDFTSDVGSEGGGVSPVGREGEPEDVAQAVVFLASDASGFITGTVLDVNGGSLMDG